MCLDVPNTVALIFLYIHNERSYAPIFFTKSVISYLMNPGTSGIDFRSNPMVIATEAFLGYLPFFFRICSKKNSFRVIAIFLRKRKTWPLTPESPNFELTKNDLSSFRRPHLGHLWCVVPEIIRGLSSTASIGSRLARAPVRGLNQRTVRRSEGTNR